MSSMPTEQDRGLVSQIGPVKIDWPRSLGYFGGVGLAVAAGLIEPPLGIFIAAVPFLKMFNRPEAPLPARFVAQVLDGASKPVGGDSEATVELSTEQDSGSSRGQAGKDRESARGGAPAAATGE